MKYQSEIVNEILEKRGHEKSSLHYQSECIETWINEAKGSYPKLTEYEAEWLNYINENPIGEFPYVTLSDVTEATINNVVPYEYKSAILKGSTKYRDIDTGEFLETFEEGRNLELVSVKMPVLTTTGKNLIDNPMIIDQDVAYELTNPIYVKKGDKLTFIVKGLSTNIQDYQMFVFGDTTDISLFKCITHTGNGSRFLEGELRTITLTAEKDGEIKYFKYGNTGHPATATIEKIMLCLGEGESYEPYKTNILTVNEEVELRGIGDVKDTLDLTTSELTQRIGEVVLDGSEDWINPTNKGSLKTFRLNKSFSTYCNQHMIPNDIICDKLKLTTPLKVWANNGYIPESPMEISRGANKNDGIDIIVDVDRMTQITDLSSFKLWLSENLINVQYIPETESIKTVDLSISDQNGNTLTKIKPIEGTMHLLTDGNPIKPTFTGEIPVEVITQNLASFIEE